MADPSRQESLRRYLEATLIMWRGALAEHMLSFHQLLLTKGQAFSGRSPAHVYAEAEAYEKERKPRPRECFYNAQMFAAYAAQYTYFEGYCVTNFLPILHGWVVTKDNCVIDHTLDACARELRCDLVEEQRNTIYLGVPVDTAYVLQQMVRTGWVKPVAADYYAIRP